MRLLDMLAIAGHQFHMQTLRYVLINLKATMKATLIEE